MSEAHSVSQPPARVCGVVVWPAVITAIRRHGRMRMIDIASECGCSEAALSDLATGRSREPMYALGRAIMRLYERTVPRGTGNTQVGEEKSA